MLNIITPNAIRPRYFQLGFLDKIADTGAVSWPVLALTRFILAFIVVAAHLVTYTDNPGPLKWICYFKAFNAILGFLLISGFSIGKSIARDKDGYFIRRAQRIYPVYVAALLFNFLIIPPHFTASFAVVILINIVFLNQVLTTTSYVGPAWTLSLEVWLYALAPYFLKLTYRQLLTLAIISFISYAAYRCGRTLFDWPYYSGVGYGLNLLLLSFTWLLGFMLARFTKKNKLTTLLILIIFAAHFLLNTSIDIVYRMLHHQLYILLTQGITLYIFEFTCLSFILLSVLYYRNTIVPSKTTKEVFNFLGNISYPLYLTHITTLDLCRIMRINNWFVLVMCCLLFSCIVYWIFDFYSKRRAS